MIDRVLAKQALTEIEGFKFQFEKSPRKGGLEWWGFRTDVKDDVIGKIKDKLQNDPRLEGWQEIVSRDGRTTGIKCVVDPTPIQVENHEDAEASEDSEPAASEVTEDNVVEA